MTYKPTDPLVLLALLGLARCVIHGSTKIRPTDNGSLLHLLLLQEPQSGLQALMRLDITLVGIVNSHCYCYLPTWK